MYNFIKISYLVDNESMTDEEYEKQQDINVENGNSLGYREALIPIEVLEEYLINNRIINTNDTIDLFEADVINTDVYYD